MEKTLYEPLALRYRPKKLEDLVGQETVVKAVRGFLKESRVPKTLLFSGRTGSGKTSTARIIARYLNCVSNKEGGVEPCGSCWSCQELSKTNHNHVDVHEINAGDARSIDDVRNWINQSKLRPRSNYRIFIIDEVHALTGASFTAFLKPLEEPSTHTIWILCTNEVTKIPETIKNRAVHFKIQPVSVEDCSTLLQRVASAEGLQPKNTAIFDKIALATHGHPRSSLQVLESVLNISKNEDINESNLDQIVTDVTMDVIGETPEIAARSFLFGVYRGKMTLPLTIIQNVNNPQFFVEAVLTLHSHTLRYLASEKLLDPYYKDFYAKLEQESFANSRNLEKVKSIPSKQKPVVLDIYLLSSLTPIFFEALTQIKSYITDPSYVVFNMTTKAVSFMHGKVE